MSAGVLFHESIGEKQKKIYSSAGKQKKRSTHLQVSCFRENIVEEQKKTSLQAYIFDDGVTLAVEKSHITPQE